MKIEHAHLTVNVSNLDHSIAFYTQIGFALKQKWGEHYAVLACAGLELGLHPTSPKNLKQHSGNLSIGLRSLDIDETAKELQNLALPFTQRNEEGGRFIHFSDPDGNSLYFIQSSY